jgi:hypothetical protein
MPKARLSINGMIPKLLETLIPKLLETLIPKLLETLKPHKKNAKKSQRTTSRASLVDQARLVRKLCHSPNLGMGVQ